MDSDDKEQKKRFCLWHKKYIESGLVNNSCQNCIIIQLENRGLSYLDPKNVTLAHGGTIANLMSKVGPAVWEDLKDNPYALMDYLATEFPSPFYPYWKKLG